ncbi:MAG: sugar kinase [Chloroflexota bacterium]|nr:sugar kinase [Chloroflexota bacterium]
MTYDLVSLGEVMLRMSPPRYERLRRASTLDVRVSGSQLNVAANLARLGWKTAFLSKLPANELGLLARDACMGYGVDTRYVTMSPGARMGVNYIDFAVEPRANSVVYDRADSAASSVTPGDFDWPGILRDVKVAYTDGIFPGLSDGCREATRLFLRTAREQGCATAFDVNYREHLWTESKAREAWSELLPFVDILVTNRSVSEAVFGFGGSDPELMGQYHKAFGSKVVCLTTREQSGLLRGAWSSKALYEGTVVEGRRYEFDVVDRFGTGDAYMSGLLYGYVGPGSLTGKLSNEKIKYALDFGDALCALAHTIEGDVAQISPSEVEALLGDNYSLRLRR